MRKLKGANFDITPGDCPWNKEENTGTHKCAVKNISICGCYFELKNADTVLCCYPKKQNAVHFILLKLGENKWIFEFIHLIRFIQMKLFGKKRILKSACECKVVKSEIDLIPNRDISWKQEPCPWNEAVNNTEHKCVCEGEPQCDYFRGIEYIDTMMCEYPLPNA